MKTVPSVALFVALCWGTCASAQTLQAGRMRLTLHAGTLTALGRDDGVVYVRGAERASLAALRRLSGDLVPVADTVAQAAELPLARTYTEFIGNEQGRLDLRLDTDPAAGDLIIEQSGSSGPGLHGIQWGIAGIPLDYQIVVPGHSGIKLDRDAPTTYQQFDYPVGWECQFVIVQGKGHGFWVWAEDAEGVYKNLRVWKKRDAWDLAFGTQNLAPFEGKTTIESVRWHLALYDGDWRVPARKYRDWAYKAFGIAAKQPDWVKDIRLLVIAGMDLKFLDQLAAQLDPHQTILYLPGWRRDGYDRNYPDYTAVPELKPFVDRAHELGFRVMLHVNYFGCDPKHELYAKFEPYQVRDPFSKQRLWWTWDRAEPPIKFAYINPACKAWRELFVSRMKEVVEKYGVDSLHLDQTLCIWNDLAGPVDGLTMIEGNLAEHRELREALPQVALSGEGLNEVTFRYEAFAQRHAWGINHTEGTWYKPWLQRAHPVASYVLLPNTTINGYLGFTSPTNDQLYAAWREAYTNWGVIPTLAHGGSEILRATTGFSRQFMDEARYFLQNRVDPDLDGPWDEDTRFPYRSASGERTRYISRDGFALVTGEPERTISQTITGVREFAGPGSIGNWRAYDDRRCFGLRPDCWYAYLPDQPLDPDAFHITSLPERVIPERVTVAPELAVIQTSARERAFAWVADLLPTARVGYAIFGGEGQEQDGPLYESEAGASFSAAGRELITLHPPWRGGTGQVYAETRLTLPAEGKINFLSEVYLEKGAIGEGKTDGVSFAVQASDGEEKLEAQVHTKSSEMTRLNLDLTPLAGKPITLRLSADPGPARNPSFDWARWRAPRIEVDDRRVETMQLVSPQAWSAAISASGLCDIRPRGGSAYELKAVFPGAVYLLRDAPREVSLPCDLTTLPFVRTYLSAQGTQLENPQYAGAQVAEAAVGGVVKRGFSTHPPNHGRTVQDFALTLPEQPVRFHCSVGLRDGSKSKGCLFIVTVTGQEVARRLVLPGGWEKLQADLSSWAGKAVVLSLVTDSDGEFGFDWAMWGEPEMR